MDRLNKDDGSITESQEELESTLNSYFAKLLQELDRDREEAQREVLSHIPKIIMEDHNQLLGKSIEMTEVETTIKQMEKDKALQPNGFTTNFFHAGWEWLKEEIRALVEDSRKFESVLRALNSTFLTLIPKESGTEDPGKLRCISLCNVIYKIISKVIANCLKPLLHIIISPEQVGFVEGRKILDGIILVHETIHSLKATKTPGMILKLDLSKAYNKLN